MLTIAAFSIALSLLSTLSLSEKLQSDDLNCHYNITHCSCQKLFNSGNCFRHIEGNTCRVEHCLDAGYACDCSGTETCELLKCKGWVNDLASPDSLSIGGVVECQKRSDMLCLRRTGETEVGPPEEERQEFRMVRFGKRSDSNMFNMTIFQDEGRIIFKSDNMHGRWKHARRLVPRFITLRMYDLPETTDRMLCAVFNTYGIEDDGLGPMSVRTSIQGSAGQVLKWVTCDDSGECRGKDGTVLVAHHQLTSRTSDGWCIKPLQWNGNGVVIIFTEVNGMKGVSFQSTAGQEESFTFSGGNGMEGYVDSDGIVKDGSTPEIEFNLMGMEVTF